MHGDCFDAFVSRHVRFGELCSDVFAYCQRRLAPHIAAAGVDWTR